MKWQPNTNNIYTHSPSRSLSSLSQVSQWQNIWQLNLEVSTHKSFRQWCVIRDIIHHIIFPKHKFSVTGSLSIFRCNKKVGRGKVPTQLGSFEWASFNHPVIKTSLFKGVNWVETLSLPYSYTRRKKDPISQNLCLIKNKITLRPEYILGASTCLWLFHGFMAKRTRFYSIRGHIHIDDLWNAGILLCSDLSEQLRGFHYN